MENQVKFCRKCGKPLKEGARFCVSCGTEIRMPLLQADQAVRPVPAIQPAQNMQPVQNVQPAPAAPPEPASQTQKKRKSKAPVIIAVAVSGTALLLAVFVVLGILVFFAANKRTENREEKVKTITEKPVSEPEEADEPDEDLAPHAVDTYMAYARQLEEAGNEEAAAAVYSMIDKAVETDAVYQEMQKMENDPVYCSVKETEAARKEYDYWKAVTEK